MASSAALNTRVALSSQMLTDSPSALSAKSAPFQLASPIWGRKLVAAKAPAQQLRASVVTAAVQWTSIPGNLKTVSISDDGKVVGTNSGDIPYSRDSGAWTGLGGSLKQVSIGAKGHWGVNMNNDVYTRDGATWRLVPGKKLKHVASGREVWGVDADNKVWKRNNQTTGDQLWDTDSVDSNLSQIDTNDYGDVWGVNSVNKVYRRVNGSWLYIPGPNGQDNIKHVTTGIMGVWAVDTENIVYRWVLTDSPTGAWFKEPSGRLSYIDSGYDSVWGCGPGDKVWKYTIAA